MISRLVSSKTDGLPDLERYNLPVILLFYVFKVLNSNVYGL